jgi:flavin reductase (DIM6/NTAB) family NADH-FMN oxidoreductase RutF
MERNIQNPDASAGASAAQIAHFRRTVGHFATGIAVLTSVGTDGAPIGMTVQSFTSVSLEPLLVSLAVSRNSTSWSRIRATNRVCINILAADQAELSRQFAKPVANRFDGVAWRPNSHGLPLLQNVLAWLDCAIDTTHVAGDHEVALCSVLDLAVNRTTEPLLFFRGAYSSTNAWRAAGADAVEGFPAPW